MRFDPRRQADGRRRPQYREQPAVAGDIPVELVVIVEIADLPVGPIGEPVSMRPLRDVGVRRTDIDADAAADAFAAPSLCLSVALHALDLELHTGRAAGSIREGQREVAEDAMPDIAALGVDRNRFGDQHRTGAIKRDRLVESTDDFGGCGRSCHEEDEEGKNKPG